MALPGRDQATRLSRTVHAQRHKQLTFNAEDLERWATEILAHNGARAQSAGITARCMIDGERRGIQTHGLAQLRQYLPRLRSGAIDGAAVAEIAVDLPGLAVIDGRNGLGAYVMDAATEVACDKARDGGAAAVLVRNSNHFGAASSFSEKAARCGCFALVVSNSDPGLAPPGALGPILGTNPIALASPPGADGYCPSLDIAASVVALGKVRLALQRGESIPLGWAIGPDGNPTEDPAAAINGSMLAMGGHKGFGLAFMIDVLVGAVAGANTSPRITSDTRSAEPQGVGHAIIAIHVESVRSIDEYMDDVDALGRIVRDAPRTSSTEAFLTPGEHEANAAFGRESSILITPPAVTLLEALGHEYGCPFPTATE